MKKIVVVSVLFLSCVLGLAQSVSEQEEFEFNRRLAKTSQSYVPKDGFVPNKEAAIAVAYAIALPIYGKKQLEGELPLRAELKDGIWTVLGSLNCGSCVGGTVVIQIDKVSGKILFLTHTQ